MSSSSTNMTSRSFYPVGVSDPYNNMLDEKMALFIPPDFQVSGEITWFPAHSEGIRNIWQMSLDKIGCGLQFQICIGHSLHAELMMSYLRERNVTFTNDCTCRFTITQKRDIEAIFDDFIRREILTEMDKSFIAADSFMSVWKALMPNIESMSQETAISTIEQIAQNNLSLRPSLEQTISRIMSEKIVHLECPISLEPFHRPWILLEDGFTYEKDAIEAWMEMNPNKSPLIGRIGTMTLRPNCAVKQALSRCPLTKKPLKMPYYCKEDGFTYEKDAILDWFYHASRKIRTDECGAPYLQSPASKIPLTTITLYPNKVLFMRGEIPQRQNPICLDVRNLLQNEGEL